ncbi:cuticle protein 7-like [Pollicipes pollicipes]|uniref:cuticle protein 7-like n=1 Tax=Pollicipes pollicipes TaxID=41117 RepID=UPI001885626B|nr:cuticle protein 7-like [Pollicipes pollicipes]
MKYGRAPSYAPSYQEPRYYAQPYQFAYAVNDHYSGSVFSQNENSDTKIVQGYYSVNLPDGRVQHVKYTADNQGYGGYNAEADRVAVALAALALLVDFDLVATQN